MAVKQFEVDVANSRNEVRNFCSVVQKVSSGELLSKRDSVAASKKASKHITSALKKWAVLKAKYANAVPQEYSGDTSFVARLDTIEQLMRSMQSQAAAGDFNGAQIKRGELCRQFVSLHEENNRDYAIDKVFHLRTAAISLIENNKIVDFDSIASQIKPLLDMRNKIVSMPCPYLENEAKCKCYTNKLERMSSALDAVAIAAGVRNEKSLQASFSALLANMNDFQNAALCCTGESNFKVAELTTD